MEARLRSSTEQYSTIVEFMERYGDISRPQPGAQGRLRAERLWGEITEILNAIGGGVQRSSEKWKKIWVDWKSKTKKKAMTIRRHTTGTGGGPSHSAALTRLEERVLAILGPIAVGGQPTVQEIGLSSNIVSHMEVPEDEEILTMPSSAPSSVELLVVGDYERQEYTTAPPLASPSSQLSSLATPVVPPATPVVPPATLVIPPPAPVASQLSPLAPFPDTRDVPPMPNRPQQEGSGSPRRRTSRRRRSDTPFERATQSFVLVEERRIRLEEERERNLQMREIQRMQLEADRIDVQRQTNNILEKLTDIAGELLIVMRNKN